MAGTTSFLTTTPSIGAMTAFLICAKSGPPAAVLISKILQYSVLLLQKAYILIVQVAVLGEIILSTMSRILVLKGFRCTIASTPITQEETRLEALRICRL